MPVLASSDKCYGCAACSNVCQKQCIEMYINEYGELRPLVNYELCVDCGLCTSVCGAMKLPHLVEPEEVIAMAINESRRKGSASGGAARALYEVALNSGAVVFGCDFDEKGILRIQSASDFEKIEKFRNSKYTFSRMEKCYFEIKSLLKKDIPVLFIGTSCQVHTLKCFLGDESEGLTTVDLICHGVPPEKYFYEYLQYRKSLSDKKIDNIKFRGDSRSEDFRLRLYSESNCIYDVFAREDPFFAGYVNCAIFEKRCYNCIFSQKERVSDITIGDWYGSTQLSANKLSLVLINSLNGKKIVQNMLAQPDVVYESHTLEEALNSNEQLRGASALPERYFEMREYYKENDFMKMSEKFITPYIEEYRRKKRNEKRKQFMMLPVRILRKIKRMMKS